MIKQYATFYVNEKLYGINVTTVQEVTRRLFLTPVPLAPIYVEGLMNLRGQVASAIALRSLIEPTTSESAAVAEMTVVCQCEDGLIALLVDKIGDVVEVTDESFEGLPDNLSFNVKSLLSGVHKLDSELLSIIEIKKLTTVLNFKEIENAA